MEMGSISVETEDMIFMTSKHRLNKNFFIEEVYYQLDDYNNMRIEIHYDDTQEQRDVIVTDLYNGLSTEVFLDSIYLIESGVFISRIDGVNVYRGSNNNICIDLLATTRKYSVKLYDLNILETKEYNLYKANKRNKFIDDIINE